MAHDLHQLFSTERMATKMNILKLLQEVRGFAHFTTRRIETRPAGPLLLNFGAGMRRRRPARRKFFIRIDMQEQPDIPCPVRIIHHPNP